MTKLNLKKPDRNIIIALLCVITFISIVFLTSFKQTENCKHEGFIKGWDATRCGCCEGWIVEVEGLTFLADSIPNMKVVLGPRENWHYPIPVYLEYKRKKYCSYRRIEITCISKR